MRTFPCRQSGCSATVEKRHSYCEKHQYNNDQTNARPWRSWYSLAIWTQIKDHFRSVAPERATTCQALDPAGVLKNAKGERICGKPATDIDHIQAHKGDWDLFVGGLSTLDYWYPNLEGLCHSCHAKKTAREEAA
jgi:hypothetical protein